MKSFLMLAALAMSPVVSAVAQNSDTGPGANSSTETKIAYAQSLIKDPNMPYMKGKDGVLGADYELVLLDHDPRTPVRLEWRYYETVAPGVVTRSKYMGPTQDDYLGYNERGTWIRHKGSTSQILVFNRQNQSLETVGEVGAPDLMVYVPKDLKNPSCDVSPKGCNEKWLYTAGYVHSDEEMRSRNAPKVQPKPVPNPNAAMGKALVDSLPAGMQGGAQGGAIPFSMKPIHGTDATVVNGVLSFTVADPQSSDNGQRKTFNVVRSNIGNPAATPSSGASGAWIAKEETRMILFAVQPDNKVTGNPMPPGAAAMFLTQPPTH